jgi:ATP-dependent DNA helicase RecG
MSYYADLDVSVIDEMPPGRTPIVTRLIADARRDEVVQRVRDACVAGSQAYWVCPLIEETEAVVAASTSSARPSRARLEALQLQTALDTYDRLKSTFPEMTVGLVHGRLPTAEKAAVMQAFKEGVIQLLVATTVIEVGVDVANATLMIIENAERMGLSQLHQLRGRVGRGEGKSTCLLIRGQTLTDVGRARLALMRETNDGFRIAEEDLRLRGPGEILGTRQSGEEAFRVATAEDVQSLAPIAQSDAQLLLDRDGGLSGERGRAARICLYLFERDQAVGLIRSG